MVTGNGYAVPNAAELALPTSLGAAVDALVGSSMARELLGEQFVEHFAATRR
jgi:glutamine synthetase